MKTKEVKERYKILFYYPKGNKNPEDYEYPENNLKKAISRVNDLRQEFKDHDIKLFNIKETIEYEEINIEE